MAIVLRDIRTAVQNYLDTHVTVTISAPTPASGVTIQPNETFTFSITGTNSASPDAIRLVNVRYHVSVANPAVAKLVVPATNPFPAVNGITYKARSGFFGPLVDLAPNAEVGEMFLFPSPSSSAGPIFIDRAGDLDVGDSDTISLTGKAGAAAAGGNSQISCNIIAEVDLDFLFTKNEDSPTATRSLVVIG
jgi:hypothetical protein